MNKACRIGWLIRNLPRFSLQRLASFPLYSYSTANPKSSNFIAYEDEVEESESSVYRHALRHQRPTTIIGQAQLENSASFIGRVDKPLELKKTKDDSVGVYTFINVSNPNTSNRTFRIQVDMWGKIAKIGLEYLKQNDMIYVSGRLCSYQKPRKNGSFTSIYAINVKELRYVDEDSIIRKLDKSLLKPFGKSKDSQTNTRNTLEESQFGEGVEICTDRSCLWQMFFSNPHEWWDKRKSKQNPSSPDFKHKFNSESLSLKADDPPWVKRQLQSLDTEIAKQRKAQGIGETGMGRNQLWHLFFSNPHEWWDNRENKKHSRVPDFKNKETGEALWIKPDDPPWIKRQLELLDSWAEQRQGESTGSSCISRWMLDDREDVR